MSITGTVRVKCPACGREQDASIVQSVNADKDAAVKKRLLAGELNVLECECGKRTPLAANVLFHDPGNNVFIRVVPGGDEAAMEKAAAQFRAAGATGVQRVVPSLNALIEKVKIFDAGLEDWAIEMTKVLLLSTIGGLDLVLLFAAADVDVLRWVRFDAYGKSPEPVASPRDAYERLAARAASRPAADEYRIDRAWAVEAVRAMVAASN